MKHFFLNRAALAAFSLLCPGLLGLSLPGTKAQSPAQLTFFIGQDRAVHPFASGANTAKWLESLTFDGAEGALIEEPSPDLGNGDPDPESRKCFIQRPQPVYYQQTFQDLAPFTLRFPGGGDQSQFIHFADSLPGFGYDLSPTGELFQYMVKKDPLEWSRKKADQLALPRGCSFLKSFIEMADLNEQTEVIYTANVITSHPLEQFNTINSLLEAGLTVRGVEMGNELYAFRVWDWGSYELKYWYDPDHGGRAAAEYLQNLQAPFTYCMDSTCFDMSFVSMVDSLERKFGVRIPIGLTAAPPEQGNESIFLLEETRRRFLDWNDTLATVRNEPWVDAYIVHLYARQLRIPCADQLAPIEDDSVFTGQELNVAFDCLEESINAYFGPFASYPFEDYLQRHVKGMADNFAATSEKVNELWLTEWGLELADRYDIALMSNTFLEAVFTQRWLHEMLRNNASLRLSHPGISITAVNRQLLTGAFEDSMVGPRSSLDARYTPDPGSTGEPWGLGSTKSPAFIRRTPYWPMAFFADLLQRDNLKSVRIDGIAPGGPLSIYGYKSEGADRDGTQLHLYFSWSDSVPYLFDTRQHLAVDPGFKEILPLSAWTFRQAEMNWLEGHALHASAGYSKHVEIASIKNPATPVPDYDYGWFHTQVSDSNSFLLPPYSFGRITLDLRTTDPRIAGSTDPQAGLHVWPNPASHTLNYHLASADAKAAKNGPAPGYLELRSMSGSLVQRWDVTDQQGSVSIAHLPAGLYALHAPAEQGRSTIRIVILPD